MTKSITCVACPLGCPISIELSDKNEIISVSGNTCKRGDTYARTELTNPTRSLTSTVKLKGGHLSVVPVKSSAPLPKDKLFECMRLINSVEVESPVKIGDIIISNILETGIDILATNIG